MGLKMYVQSCSGIQDVVWSRLKTGRKRCCKLTSDVPQASKLDEALSAK